MPRGGSKPGERRGGRQKGTPNKRTIEQRLFSEKRGVNGRLLAKEVLEAGMLTYLELAARYLPPERGQWTKEHQRFFHLYRHKADERARWLAPYQSPQYRSLTVTQPREKSAKGTPAVDALEDFMLRLAKARRHLNPPELKTVEAVALPDETPAEAAKVIDGKNGHNNGR
jgi:hypothetical protein